jgi:two-component system, LytTR family, response regulator LytT
LNSVRAIIVEDEKGAADNLQLQLAEIAPDITVLAILPDIEQSVAWLSGNRAPDLAFFDIQLEDGVSFEIFKKVEIDFPIIFTTAFDSYAIDAFKVNSVDYLLKPIREEDLKFSLDKYRKLNGSNVSRTMIDKIADSMRAKQGWSTFLIHYKGKLIPIAEKDFAYFYIDKGLVHGCTHANQTYLMEQTVEELDRQLNDKQFFRANRQYIVNRAAIKEAEFYFNGRLLLKLSPACKDDVLISKVRVPVFKDWITRASVL